MVKFLDTQKISSELNDLLREAKKEILIISPYLKVNGQIQERIKTKSLNPVIDIKIIYGKTDMDKSQVQWMKNIDDLKVFEKKNLHAKCYMNEEKAIICSMNLYDYSQQNNVEMGVLLSKSKNPEAFVELQNEIENILINSKRKKLNEMNFSDTKNEINNNDSNDEETKIDNTVSLTLEQKKKVCALKIWRKETSKSKKVPAYAILKNNQILEIVLSNKSKKGLYSILSTKIVNSYGDEIMDVISSTTKYKIVKIINTSYSDETGYDTIKVKYLDTEKTEELITVKEVPAKGKIVAVKINREWFNDYFYIEDL